MLRNVFQSGIVSIYYSLGSDPLQLWEKQPGPSGNIEMVQDPVLKSQVLEIKSENISQTYISCPSESLGSLGVKLPVFSIQFKADSKYFSFEIQILDDKRVTRRFRVSNFVMMAKSKPYIATLPLQVEEGVWSSVSLDLADLTKRIYGTGFQEVVKHGALHQDDAPPELKLYSPTLPS